MSAPSPSSLSTHLDLKAVSRQLESFQQVDSTRQLLLERLLQRLSELDTALQAANSDLEDQTSIRRQWKKRAEVAEASLAQSQFVLALIDGNRYTFADSYLKNMETGGADAASNLVEQIRSYIQKRSLHDNPNKVALMIYIFANKTALSQALVDSGTISEPSELDNFIAQFMSSQPFFYFMDCGSSKGAVDSKIKESYEFHFENAHCKHLFLALRHESGYITELDTYREDESTLARTSLMRSSRAVAGNFASAFHVVNTPALSTIALISLEHANSTSVEKNEESRSSVIRTRISNRNHDLQGLFEVEDQGSPVTEQDGVNQSNGIDPTARERDSSTTSNNAAVPRDGEAPGPPERIQSPQMLQETKNSIKVTMPPAKPVYHSNTAPYLGSVHSYMNDWESAPSSDIYTPPPDLRPWDSEDVPSWDAVANTNSNDNRTEKAPNRTSSREATQKGSDMSERTAGGIYDHPHHGKGASSCPICRKAKQSPKQALPPLRYSAKDTPEFVPTGVGVASSGLLESKFSSPSGKPSTPQPAGNANVAVNRHGQRIDLPLQRPSADDQARYDSRWHAQKLCNDHHLRGECSNQNCKFDHSPIDEGLRMALRIFARNIACKNGTGCRRQNCPNGHHCPYQLNGGRCTNKQCVFLAKGMHKVDELTVEKFVQSQ